MKECEQNLYLPRDVGERSEKWKKTHCISETITYEASWDTRKTCISRQVLLYLADCRERVSCIKFKICLSNSKARVQFFH